MRRVDSTTPAADKRWALLKRSKARGTGKLSIAMESIDGRLLAQRRRWRRQQERLRLHKKIDANRLRH